jgi:hypothetical protein
MCSVSIEHFTRYRDVSYLLSTFLQSQTVSNSKEEVSAKMLANNSGGKWNRMINNIVNQLGRSLVLPAQASAEAHHRQAHQNPRKHIESND